MGHTLIARNKQVPAFNIGYGSYFHIMTLSGACYIIGFGKGLNSELTVAQNEERLIINRTDEYGEECTEYYITEEMCNNILPILRSWVDIETFSAELYNSWPDEKKKEHIEDCKRYPSNHKIPVPSLLLERGEQLYEFIKSSKGFYMSLLY